MCFTVTRSRGATWGTSSVTTVRNTTFSCSTLLWARLWTSAGGVCSAVPYMNTAVPGTRSGGSAARSEERRVGKECRSRWSPDHSKKKKNKAEGKKDKLDKKERHKEGDEKCRMR